MSNPNYIIIAGISKAGTTSLFDYLEAHPEIEGSSIKQTFFFLDKDLQKQLNLKANYDYEKGLDQFEQYFLNSKNKIKYRVEATPDYLYSPGTPKRLSSFFEKRQGKVVMILRDPVSRFNSFYYYGKQQGLIPEEMTYEEFYNTSKSYTEDTNPCLMAHKTGFYAKYLAPYKAKFGSELEVVFFEDLKENPQILLRQLCKKLNINADFYQDYDFIVKNATVQTRNRRMANIYSKMRQFYLNHFYESKIGVAIAKTLKKTITPIYKKINYQPLQKNKHDECINELLRDDYKEDIDTLKSLIAQEVPWKQSKKNKLENELL